MTIILAFHFYSILFSSNENFHEKLSNNVPFGISRRLDGVFERGLLPRRCKRASHTLGDPRETPISPRRPRLINLISHPFSPIVFAFRPTRSQQRQHPTSSPFVSANLSKSLGIRSFVYHGFGRDRGRK